MFDALSLLMGLAFGGALVLVAGYLRADRPVLTSRRLAIAVIGIFLSVGLLELGAALSSGLLEAAAVPLGFALAYLVTGLGAPRPN